MKKGRKRTWSEAVQISALFVLLLFAVRLVDVLLPIDFNWFGIIPRTWVGLRGVLFSPLLHGSMNHLLANSTSLFILGIVLLADRDYYPTQTFGFIWILSGFGTWVIGRPAVHIGASSLIYGLVVYLVISGFYLRSWRAVTIALLVLFFYGGIVYGMLPQAGIVSWEGHLCGALAGAAAARHYHG